MAFGNILGKLAPSMTNLNNKVMTQVAQKSPTHSKLAQGIMDRGTGVTNQLRTNQQVAQRFTSPGFARGLGTYVDVAKAANIIKQADPTIQVPQKMNAQQAQALITTAQQLAPEQFAAPPPAPGGMPMQGPGFPADAVSPNQNPFASPMPMGMQNYGMPTQAAAQYNLAPPVEPKKDRTLLYVGGGVAALAVLYLVMR